MWKQRCSPRPKNAWSEREEKLLCKLVEEEGSRVADWEAKAEHFVGRTENMLRRKWYEDLRERVRRRGGGRRSGREELAPSNKRGA